LPELIERGNNSISLHDSRANKNDEFYTQYLDIENELKHYKEKFKNKVVYCNCDDPEISNFYMYFSNNFDHLKLKKLICTHYSKDETTYKLVLEKDRNKDGKINSKDVERLEFMFSDGDFRSDECIELLKQADIVVTNPPFSLFREYVEQLINYEKNFLIIGSKNAITYKDIFKLIKENKIWLGYGFTNGNAYFSIANKRNFSNGVYDCKTGLVKFRNVGWFTNIDFKERHEEFIPKKYKKYKGNENEYPAYDNYNAINIDKTELIPIDYKGVMGVPVTFLDKFNPDQFEIVGKNDADNDLAGGVKTSFNSGNKISLNNKYIYHRIFIKRKRNKGK
jgi:hypothetical protein